MEGKVGTLEEGKYADMAILSQDLFAVDPVDLPAVQVDLTIVEGEIVYRRDGSNE